MKQLTVFHLLALLTTPLFSLLAQPFPGLSMDNYAGVHGLLLNPANAAANNVGFELHLASAGLRLDNDYITLPKVSTLLEDGEVYTDALARNSREDNFVATNTEVLGPSLLLGLGQYFGLGVLTRVRAMQDIRGIDGRILEGQQDSFEDFSDFSGTFQDFRSNLHTWGEVAVVLGAVLVNKPQLQVKGGASVKLLRGLGGYYANSPSLSVAYDANREALTTGGNLTYATPGEFELDDFELSDLQETPGSGMGFDVGLTMEWRPDELPEGKLRTPYRLKVGLSLMDLGAVTYDDTEVSSYQVDATLATEDVEGYSLGDILEEHYDGTTRQEATDFRLPTALYLYLDYRVAGGLYVSALSASAVGDDPLNAGNRIENALTIAPRFESKWFSLYAPARLGGPSGTAFGAGVRLGFVTLGSHTLLSHLFTDTNYAADVYAGVKLPFYRRTNARTPSEN